MKGYDVATEGKIKRWSNLKTYEARSLFHLFNVKET